MGRFLVPILFLVLCASPGSGAADQETLKLDLADALALARENSPLVRAARQRIGEASGDLAAASVLLRNNPVASVTYGRRTSDAGVPAQRDSDIALSQEFEIAGQRGARIGLATAEVESARATAANVERTILAAVSTAFFDALVAAERLRLAQGNMRLAEELLEIARIRVEKGASAPLELNASRIRHALARTQEAEVRSAEIRARIALLALMGIEPASPVQLQGSVPAAEDMPDLHALLAQARNRPDVAAAEAEVRAAEADIRLADADRFPSPTLGGSYARDEGDRIVSGTLSVALPVFQRNQGERQRTRAALLRVREELASLRLVVEREVRELFTEYMKARETLSFYDSEVAKAMEENVVLLRTMFVAGKVGYADVALLQRERIETSLALLRAQSDVAIAAVNLRAAAGLPLSLATGPGVSR